MELDDLSEGVGAERMNRSITQGQQFGIVQKMEKSYRSFAKYGTVCEIQAHEQTQTIVFNPFERNTGAQGNTMVQAMGIHRFRIDRVLHRALDGLILTCEVTNFVEEGNEIDIKLGQTPLFTTMQLKGVEFCQLSQKLASHAARAKAYEQKRKLLEETSSASALTFLVC